MSELMNYMRVCMKLRNTEKMNDLHFYVARDKDGELFLYLEKPFRGDALWELIEGCYPLAYGEHLHKFGLCPEDYKDMKWEDEPQEVSIKFIRN